MKKRTHSTGFIAPDEPGCPSPAAIPPRSPVRPPGAGWITDEMIEDTRRHWSPRYGYELSDTEAVEILMNIKRLAQVLIRIGGGSQ